MKILIVLAESTRAGGSGKPSGPVPVGASITRDRTFGVFRGENH
jgi:hypothetical protein